ncbi:pyridoxamine 5'-phosphate oxidase family protein [Roseibium sp.]|uniref:pyridoxamine 5'-phosphate oxidase family protein n=4 Tax=Roseibium sp. TaxID=1936156 RepID=UPI003265AC03
MDSPSQPEPVEPASSKQSTNRSTSDRPSYAKIRQMNRGSYDQDLAFSILDAGLIGHLGFLADDRAMVIPMVYARKGHTLYIHGASTTRIVKSQKDGAPVTLAVTLLDGLVVARAAFHLSMNYRSAVVHGTARQVRSDAEKEEAMAAITDHMLPGRWNESRPMLAKELKATGILAVEIEHVATKVRSGPPVDDEEDHQLDIWAGVLPVATAIGQPLADQHVKPDQPVPASLQAAKRRFA